MTSITAVGAGSTDEEPVERTVRNPNLWLAIAYVSLILLLTRTYA